MLQLYCPTAAFAANTAQAVTLDEAMASLCPTIQAEYAKQTLLSTIFSLLGDVEVGGERGGRRGSTSCVIVNTHHLVLYPAPPAPFTV